MEGFQIQVPSIRGIQAGKEFYVSMFPLKYIPKLLLYDEQELDLDPELRAQRTLNRSRIPEMTRYVVENPKNYTFSAITASIDGDVIFEPQADHDLGRNIGRLIIPMSSRFLVNDGQHRRAAIVEALKQRPEMGDETISVVLFVDTGLKRSQQMFADLNKHVFVPPSLWVSFTITATLFPNWQGNLHLLFRSSLGLPRWKKPQFQTVQLNYSP